MSGDAEEGVMEFTTILGLCGLYLCLERMFELLFQGIVRTAHLVRKIYTWGSPWLKKVSSCCFDLGFASAEDTLATVAFKPYAIVDCFGFGCPGRFFTFLAVAYSAMTSLFFVMLLLAVFPFPALADDMQCIDALNGNTLLFMQGGQSGWRIEVELASVDAPQDADIARQAENILRHVCLDRGPLRLEYPFGKSGAGRRDVRAFVFDESGRMLNREVIRAGLGRYRKEPARYQKELSDAERFAREQGVGGWGD